MTTTQRRLALGAIIVVILIITALVIVYLYPGMGFNKGNKIDTAVKTQAQPLYNRLERTIGRLEQKQLEEKNNKQAYARDKKTKAYVDSLKDVLWILNDIKGNAQPVAQYLNNEELSGDELDKAKEGILKFIELQPETDSVIGVADLLYHNFHQYQIAEKDQIIEEQAEEIKKYKRLANKYRSMYASLNERLETATATVDSLEAQLNGSAQVDTLGQLNNSAQARSAQTAISSARTDSLELALQEQKAIAEALRDSVNSFPQFEIIKLSATPFEAKNFRRSDHWNLNHIAKHGFYVDLLVENFKHPYDTVQLNIIVDVPINKDEYKTFEADIVYNLKDNTHNKLEFFPENLRNGVINFSVYRGSRFLRLETMRIRKPTLFPSKIDESNEGKRNIDPDFKEDKND